MQADGISSGEIFFRKLLVDHDGGRDPVPYLGTVLDLVVVVDGEVTTRDDGDAERGEIVWADGVHIRFSMLTGLGGSETLDGHAAVPFVVFENAHGRESDGLHSGNGPESVR